MKWEYLVQNMFPTTQDKIQKDLDGWGKEGWELVTTILVNNTLCYVFKRKVEE